MRFESLKIRFDELLSLSLDNLDKFEKVLVKKRSKRFNYQTDLIDDNRGIEINLKNFPFKSCEVIKQIHIGSTDLIKIDMHLYHIE